MTLHDFLLSKGCTCTADEFGYVYKFNDDLVLIDDVSYIIAFSIFLPDIVSALGPYDFSIQYYYVWETGL